MRQADSRKPVGTDSCDSALLKPVAGAAYDVPLQCREESTTSAVCEKLDGFHVGL